MSWNHFSYEQDRMLACPCCGKKGMDEAFMLDLDALRGHLGFPLTITSGYRCPDYNESLSSTGRDGPHTTGRAVDISLSGERVYLLIDHLRKYGMTGLGLKQKGDYSGRFVHIDNLSGVNRPRVWTY